MKDRQWEMRLGNVGGRSIQVNLLSEPPYLGYSETIDLVKYREPDYLVGGRGVGSYHSVGRFRRRKGGWNLLLTERAFALTPDELADLLAIARMAFEELHQWDSYNIEEQQ